MKLRNSLFLLIVFLLISICTIDAKDALFITRPYLQDIRQTSVYVLAQPNSKDTVYIKFKEVGTDSERTATTEYYETIKYRHGIRVHRIKLDGLKPSTDYIYNAYTGSEKAEGGVFRTAPRPGENFRFVVCGDNRSHPKTHDKIQSLIRQYNPNMWIVTGDISFTNEYESFKNQFFTDSCQALIASTPFYNAVGNHESGKAILALLQAPESPSGNQLYYSFDYGDIHFLVLNTEEDCSEGSKQWKFAEADLKATKLPWKIAVFHRPGYVGGHYHGPFKPMINMSDKLFKPLGVDMTFSAHIHFYQHSIVDGVHYFVFAGGGAELYEPSDEPFVVKSVKIHHFGIFDYQPGKLKLTVYDIDNKIIDELEFTK